MIQLHKSTRFALYSIVELSQDPQGILSAKEIAKKYMISEHHVAKVLQQLSRAGIIRSIRGIKGGFQMIQDPKSVTMLDIIEIFEPRLPQNACNIMDLTECPKKSACSIGEVFHEIQDQAYYTLKSVSIATLISPKKIS